MGGHCGKKLLTDQCLFDTGVRTRAKVHSVVIQLTVAQHRAINPMWEEN